MNAAYVLGTIGTIGCLIGSWLTGNKNRKGFLSIALGEVFWITSAVYREAWDLLPLCIVFLALALRNYLKWSK
jgi:hypothetical protein